jgi:nucleoside-diphosphate-sugar epimerase
VKVLLTGCTGFVGKQVLAALRTSGAPVRALVRRGGRGAPAGVESIEIDDLFNAQPAELQRIVAGIDTVVHLAWYAEPGKYLSSDINITCLQGTLRLAEAFAMSGGRRFVGIGTCAEYDQSLGYLSASTPLNPTTLYGSAKASAFLTLKEFLPPRGVEFAWGRLFYLYGDGEDPRRLVPYIEKQLAAGEEALLTSGKQVRDFLDVVDAGALIARLALGSITGAVNICSGSPTTVRALAERVADRYDRRDLLRFGARHENAFDPQVSVGIPDERLRVPNEFSTSACGSLHGEEG